MPTWRDSASPQAQRDLDELLNTALGFAQQQLAQAGEFYPYAVAIRADGQTEMIPGQLDQASEYPTAADILTSSIAALTSRGHAIRAGAIIADVRILEFDSNAIEVTLEHAEGQSLRVQLPYTKQSNEINYGSLRASTAPRRVWTHS